jgi:hypothetical protein
LFYEINPGAQFHQEKGIRAMVLKNKGLLQNKSLLSVQKVFFFRYRLVEPEDGSWGFIDANGTWGGLIGLAHYGKV